MIKSKKLKISLKLSKGWRFISALVIAFLLTFNFSWVATAAAKHYTDLKFAPLPEIKLPEYERFKLNNGLVVYLVEDHELPLISGTALIKTGSRLEPSEKTGLAEITGSLIRTGGTLKHPPDQLNEILEQRAASVETSISQTNGNASFNTLTEDLDTVFGLFAEVLQEPVFTPEKLEFIKTQLQGGIARRNDDPGEIASREFKKLVYGQESPYSRTVEYTTLDNIKREDVIKFYQQYYYPDNMILGIVGDFDSQKMKSLIAAKFGDWKPNPEVVITPLPKVATNNTGGVFFVNQPQLTQSSIRIGHLGSTFNNPDFGALSVMNGVFNGFGGRLFNELRSRQGLAYSVYGVWSSRFDYPGMFIGGGQTRSDATVQFIKALKTEIKRMQTQKVTEKELNYAKESTLNSFVFNFQKPSQTLSRLMRYEYYGYPADFLFTYQKAVKETTTADVQRVAKKYLKPDNLVTLVVGNETAIQPPLTQLSAEVQSIDVTIPSPQTQAQK